MVGGLGIQRGTRRAYLALSFAEEQHALLGEAYRALAARLRRQHLESSGAGPTELASACQKFDQLREELRQNILTAASHEALTDGTAMKAVLSIPELRKDCEVAGQLLEAWPDAWDLVDRELFQNGDVAKRIIRKHGWWLRHASPELQDDKDVVLSALSSDPWALEFASAALQADREVVLAAVSDHRSCMERAQANWPRNLANAGVLRFASVDLRNDKEVILAAIASDPWNLKYASNALKGDREIVLAALRRQTREDVSFRYGHNVLSEAGDALHADRDLVLEALRVDAGALAIASMELRLDRDFVFEAMRRVPSNHRQLCHFLARSWLPKLGEEQVWLAAANSRLAMPGEPAPVLSVNLTSAPRSHKKRLRVKSKSINISSCEVNLISGASFTCSLTNQSGEATEVGEPAAKRPRSGSATLEIPPSEAPEQPEPCSTVGRLAELLWAELPRHVQMTPPLPERIFIVFAKQGMDTDAVPVTPWDWDRPLSDFV